MQYLLCQTDLRTDWYLPKSHQSEIIINRWFPWVPEQ